MRSVLSSAYWPNIHYFYYILNSEVIFIDLYEHFEKQSFRNRTLILTANGELNLSIPVKKWETKATTKSIEISYAEDWQKQHWRAIQSAYKNSPYFDFLEDEIRSFYEQEYKYLHEYNADQLKWLLKAFRLKREIVYTSEYFENINGDILDLRQLIHPKKEVTPAELKIVIDTPYYQTFSTKFGFTPNLSVLDLIFNEGIKSYKYLT
ncbi:MAG: WbqC family protein [Sphingobacteriaceae bacterium]|jgi:hypothetical protein